MSAWLIHGGRVKAAQARFGGAARDWLDLSTGINPHAWHGADAVAIDWRALPEPEALTSLEAAAAAHFGICTERLCAIPGTEIGLRLMGLLLPPDAVHLAPSYRTHAQAVAGSRAIGPEELEDAARSGRTILLANPNNPDGRLIAPGRLLELAALARGSGGRLVIDEAFADCLEGTSLAGEVSEDLPLVLFRSFGKFFGLAGLRLGFVLGPRSIVAAFRGRLGDWPVSSAAIAIGAEAYRDIAWTRAMRGRLAAEAASLDALLASHSLTPKGACPLFRLIETEDAARLFERLAGRRILTRPFDDRPGWLRLGLPGGPEGLARLDAALRDG